jgi:hypothetical protein
MLGDLREISRILGTSSAEVFASDRNDWKHNDLSEFIMSKKDQLGNFTSGPKPAGYGGSAPAATVQSKPRPSIDSRFGNLQATEIAHYMRAAVEEGESGGGFFSNTATTLATQMNDQNKPQRSDFDRVNPPQTEASTASGFGNREAEKKKKKWWQFWK